MGTSAINISYTLCFFSFIYMLIGIYGLSLNRSKKVNQVFFMMSFTAALWALGYSGAVSADSEQTALLFVELSALGYAFFYSVVLHVLTLVSRNINKISKRQFILFYAPSVYYLFTYLLLPNIAHTQFNMIHTVYGWSYLATNTFTNYSFDIYGFVFCALCFKACIHWKKQSNDKLTSNLVKITAISILVSIIFSSTTDIILSRILKESRFHFTIFHMLIPISALFYVLLKTKVISPIVEVDFADNIDDKSREFIFTLLGFLYLILVYAIFITDYLTVEHYKLNSLPIAILSFFISISFIIFTLVIKNERLQDVFIILISIFTNYIIFIRYSNDATITVWAISFCYIVLTAMFREKYVSFCIYLGAAIFQIIFWIEAPKQVIFVDWTDYLFRIVLFTLTFYLVYYINSAYKKKSINNYEYIQTQKVVNEFSGKIIELSVYSSEKEVSDFLEILNTGFDFHRTIYLSFYPEDDNELREVLLIDRDFKTIEYDYTNTIFNNNQSLLDKLKLGETVEVNDVSLNAELNSIVKKDFADRGINCFYTFPIFLNQILRVIIVFEFNLSLRTSMIRFYEDMLKNLASETLKKIDSERELFKKANFDSITGLKNRNYFLSQVEKELNKYPDNNYYLLYVDINNFKLVNDIFGHSAGDQVLASIARELIDLGNPENMVTRLGNDDFIIFCDHSYTREAIEEFAKDIIEQFKKGITVFDNEFRLNISIGIASSENDAKDIDILLKDADIAMLEAKKAKYKGYHFFDKENKDNMLEVSQYADSLFLALKNNELSLAFQPQVDCITDEVIGAEALLRWNSPRFGFIPPNKFIHILESTGLIVEVGEWIIEEAIKQQLMLEKKGYKPIKISINLSAVQFLDTSLIDKIEHFIGQYRFEPKNIEFEITESVMINDDIYINECFTKLKNLGFSLAIDDFGTGFSSLNKLQHLPLDRLKIDKSFVDGIGNDIKKEQILNIIIQLAHSLDLYSIAEGVEEEYQLNYLKEKKCREIQGYYYAKPMYKEEFEEFIKGHN